MIIALRTMLLCAALSLVVIWSPESSTMVQASGAVRSTKLGGKTTAHGCQGSCGNLSFVYPFGIGPECSRGPDFRLSCDEATRPPKLFMQDGITEVMDNIGVSRDGNDFGLPNVIRTSIWSVIPMKSGVRVYNWTLEPPGKSFLWAYTDLNITGCDLNVYWVNQMAGRTTWVCSTSCPGTEITETAARHNCSGVGCCQVRVESVWNVFQLRFMSATWTARGTSLLWDRITISSDSAMLLWSIVEQQSCLAKGNQTNSACISNNASCYDYTPSFSRYDDTTSSNGYLCRCNVGYAGNPYVLDGCTTDKGYNPNQIRADCTRQCGNVSVQFPFGLEEGCFARKQFHLVCTNATPSAALKWEDFQVIDLDVNEGTIKYTDPGQPIDEVYAFTGGRNIFIGVLELVHTISWFAATLSCIEAQQNRSGYACVSINSRCVQVNSSTGNVGYQCKCSDGFHGNPYIQSGCRDINECLKQNICNGSVCHNTNGGFLCTECARNTEYDPAKNQCTRTKQKVLIVGVIIGFSGGFSILLLSFVAVFIFRKWKSNVQKALRKSYFEKNQGLLLEQLSSEKTNVFSLEELEKATNNFDPTRIVGRGGHGMVYKGILSDQRVVAIKKSKVIELSEIKQFINEVAILSQINHRNILKLLGCCLEVEVPMLVYDYISSGSLSQALHSYSRSDFCLSWDDYIRIATETAAAISYLHSAASISIFHRDVKSSNILLDGNYTAKVSDFGASRLVPIGQTHIVTNVQGTFGYLDPEYFHTKQLNEKSDVYSFGVVLLELLIREKPVFRTKSGIVQNLSNYFLQALREKDISDIVHSQIIEEATKEEIRSVASLAEMCLRLRGEERPTMKQVELELQILRKKQIIRSCKNDQEIE